MGSRWKSKGLELGPEYRLASFEQLEGRAVFADVRAAWNDAGLALSLLVAGKKRPPLGDEDHPTQGDGLQVWIDTRDTHNVHRATRFCHWFVLLPNGGGKRRDEPMAEHLWIHRAKENPKRAESKQILLRSEKRVDGYLLEAFLPAEVLTGWEPAEHPRLGFTYMVNDREMGQQTFSCSQHFPFREDPSLWGTLELTE
jgi:hypothetical protein